LCFSQDAHWLISASLDCTVKVWDLPSAALIDVLAFSHPCCSLTVSSGGQYLATAHCDKRGIYLWANKTLYFPCIVLNALPLDYEPEPIDLLGSTATASEKQDDSMAIENHDERYESPEQLQSLISLSSLPSTRWAYLMDLETIKERSKPIEPPKKPIHAPFFLPTIPGLVPKWADLDEGDILKSDGVNEPRKIVSFAQLDFRSDFAKQLERCNGKSFWPAFEVLKQYGPSGVYLELSNLSPLNGGSVNLMTSFLRMIKEVLDSRRCFELANSYLALFLQLHRETLWKESRFEDILKPLAESQSSSWQRIDELFMDCQCLLKFFRSSLSA
uniref:WD_REPEATS_REGION domain-containing protein n=1 Tax=Soboliphyme baturini TaxID=241478 RepID=A0A183J8F8_9BILA